MTTATPSMATDTSSPQPTHRTQSRSGDLLVDLVAGQPLSLSGAQCDLIAWVNNRPSVLHPDADPSLASPAQLALEWFAEYVGKQAKTDGDRAVGLARRYGVTALGWVVAGRGLTHTWSWVTE